MSGQMDKCIACGDMVFYADEKVIGTWNGEPNTRFDLLNFDEHGEAYSGTQEIPEGYLVYCLDCAPCECEFHPPFMSDKEARDAGWCFLPSCDFVEAHRHA
jgi:hypothetical protein